MKKTAMAVILCTLLMCLASCGKTPVFENQSAMFEYLEGMWIVENNQESDYYVFQDGQVYYTNDATFEYEVEQLLDDILNSTGTNELISLDYTAALNVLKTEDVLRSPEDNVCIKPEKGELIFDEGEYYEKRIVIEENTVVIKDADDRYGTTLKRLSEKVDFSGDHFEAIFENVKSEYTVPTFQFWTDTEEYGNMVKSLNPEVDGWNLIERTETTTIYQSSDWVPNISGALIISDESVTYTHKVSLSGTDWSPQFTISYTPVDGAIMIFDMDNLSLDLMQLLQYGAYAVKDFPGAVSYTELYDIFAEDINAGNCVISSGAATVEKTINGITYNVQIGTDASWAIVRVSTDENIKLSDIAQYTNEGASQESKEDFSQETVPSVTESQYSFEESLQQSKYWSMEWYDSGALYSACFGFEDSGTCYMLLNAGFEILSTGIGSYTVDGNEVSIDIVLDGESNYSYDFRYDQKTGTFIQTSNSGIAYYHNAGDQFAIETANITVAGKMQEIFASSLPGGVDDSNDPVATDPPATKPTATEAPTTKPAATKPAATEAPATKPAATKPPATQGPTECPHEYSFATCTEPQTCIHCGDTIGEPLGHTYSDATCTAPKTCTRCGQESGSALGHSWTAITETIHHEEEGHYEEQQDAVEVQMYRCPMCSYDQPDYATLDEYYAHFDSEHGDDPTSGFLRGAYELVDDWVYETVTVWVVDQEEYTETVVVGQECEVCGEKEEY